ncbi:uncharacterized protein IL334_006448 [Kwoniella shivajii]|uniref:Isochorismatase-like domain-containing protein n=1 Tax=Kwoniella shivajii TaxID=564305 RepID=A0ABZ1D9X3_9TREE|nr:hypothetical protein IL334_006448 [Kwoniella shivajii]
MVAPRPLLLICDVQERFRSAIFGFDQMTGTIQKMLKVAKILEIPTLATEQNPKALGSTITELNNLFDPSRHLGTFSKTTFSMVTYDDTLPVLEKHGHEAYIITGIESHVCVLQTALHLRRLPTEPEVYVLADGISSCNKPEISIALKRMEVAGVKVTTSESLIFELLCDANHSKFKQIASLIKNEKSNTAEALKTLCVE